MFGIQGTGALRVVLKMMVWLMERDCRCDIWLRREIVVVGGFDRGCWLVQD